MQNLKSCPIDDRTWNDESRSLFLRLLASGPALLQVWEEIDFVDIPGRFDSGMVGDS